MARQVLAEKWMRDFLEATSEAGNSPQKQIKIVAGLSPAEGHETWQQYKYFRIELLAFLRRVVGLTILGCLMRINGPAQAESVQLKESTMKCLRKDYTPLCMEPEELCQEDRLQENQNG